MLPLRHLRSVLCVAIALGGAAPAAAADLSATLGLVSDYRFRGMSLSDRGPAVQGGVDLALSPGWSAGLFTSTIEEYGGAHAEIDLYASRAGAVRGIDYSITAYGYFYPGGNDVNYAEVQAQIGRTVGALTVTLDAAYSPEQRNTGCENVYAGAGVALAIPATPLTASVRAGYEDGFYDRKIDWEAGIAYATDAVTLSAAVVGTNRGGADELGRMAQRGVVLSAVANF